MVPSKSKSESETDEMMKRLYPVELPDEVANKIRRDMSTVRNAVTLTIQQMGAENQPAFAMHTMWTMQEVVERIDESYPHGRLPEPERSREFDESKKSLVKLRVETVLDLCVALHKATKAALKEHAKKLAPESVLYLQVAKAKLQQVVVKLSDLLDHESYIGV